MKIINKCEEKKAPAAAAAAPTVNPLVDQIVAIPVGSVFSIDIAMRHNPIYMRLSVRAASLNPKNPLHVVDLNNGYLYTAAEVALGVLGRMASIVMHPNVTLVKEGC